MTRAKFLASKTSRRLTLRETSISRRIFSVSWRERVEFSMALELKTLSGISESSISFSSVLLPFLNWSNWAFRSAICFIAAGRNMGFR